MENSYRLLYVSNHLSTDLFLKILKGSFIYLSNLYTCCGARTHNPEIRSLMFFQLRQPSTPRILFKRRGTFLQILTFAVQTIAVYIWLLASQGNSLSQILALKFNDCSLVLWVFDLLSVYYSWPFHSILLCSPDHVRLSNFSSSQLTIR